MSGANIAARAIIIMRIAPVTASLLRRSRIQASPHNVWWGRGEQVASAVTADFSAVVVGLVIADSRVNHCVQYVHGQINYCYEEGIKQHRPHNQAVVALENALDK